MSNTAAPVMLDAQLLAHPFMTSLFSGEYDDPDSGVVYDVEKLFVLWSQNGMGVADYSEDESVFYMHNPGFDGLTVVLGTASKVVCLAIPTTEPIPDAL